MAALIAVAETAQDVGSVFFKFLDQVTESSTEIAALISEVFAISSALQDLTTAIRDPRYSRNYAFIAEDVRVAQDSLEYTFNDALRLFGGLGSVIHVSTGAAYRQVWREICAHFQTESRNSLCTRLEYYRLFLHALADRIKVNPYNIDIFDDLRDRIVALLAIQDRRLEDAFNNLSLGSPGTARQRSFERTRPAGAHLQTTPESPNIPRGSRRWTGPQSPMSPGVDQEFFPWVPPAPEVPRSPSTTNTFSTQSSNNSCYVNHWVPKVFEQSRSTTKFHTTGQVSACFGVDMPGAAGRLADEFEKLLDLPLENGDLLLRLYFRPDDDRARIHFRSLRVNQSRKQCCLPLASLRVAREGPSLKLCQTSQSRQSLELWACIRFPSYERMILFFCTFLALRSADADCPRIDDHEVRGEKEIFSGKIIDDHYQHALKLFKDRDSGGIRLQASVLSRELKRTPVWTAFITHHIDSRQWMRKASSHTIHLADLQRYVFTTDYNPQLGPGGEHELCFINSHDANAFFHAVHDLADS